MKDRDSERDETERERQGETSSMTDVKMGERKRDNKRAKS